MCEQQHFSDRICYVPIIGTAFFIKTVLNALATIENGSKKKRVG